MDLQILLDFLFRPLRFQGFDNDPYAPSLLLFSFSLVHSRSSMLLEWLAALRSNRRKFVRPVAVIDSKRDPSSPLLTLLARFFPLFFDLRRPWLRLTDKDGRPVIEHLDHDGKLTS